MKEESLNLGKALMNGETHVVELFLPSLPERTPYIFCVTRDQGGQEVLGEL